MFLNLLINFQHCFFCRHVKETQLLRKVGDYCYFILFQTIFSPNESQQIQVKCQQKDGILFTYMKFSHRMLLSWFQGSETHYNSSFVVKINRLNSARAPAEHLELTGSTPLHLSYPPHGSDMPTSWPGAVHSRGGQNNWPAVLPKPSAFTCKRIWNGDKTESAEQVPISLQRFSSSPKLLGWVIFVLLQFPENITS